MTRRAVLALLGRIASAAVLGANERDSRAAAAQRNVSMTTPAHIGKFTANNPGIMTLQGTNQYVVGKDSVAVIDVALSARRGQQRLRLRDAGERVECAILLPLHRECRGDVVPGGRIVGPSGHARVE